MTIKSLFSIAILTLGLCLLGCNSTPEESKSQNTDKQPVAQTQDTVSANNYDYNYSSVQVVNSERFMDEVAVFENGKYGFKCTKPCIIDFYANWCGPCAQIAPYLAEFAEKYAGQIVIYKVNIDNCQDIAAAFKIESIPTLIFVNPKTGPVQIVGGIPKDKLEKQIKDLLLK